jgi:hypothetical protein
MVEVQFSSVRKYASKTGRKMTFFAHNFFSMLATDLAKKKSSKDIVLGGAESNAKNPVTLRGRQVPSELTNSIVMSLRVPAFVISLTVASQKQPRRATVQMPM